MVVGGLELVYLCETRIKMEHAVPSENFQRENGTTFSEVPLFPEIFQWDEPKNHVPFTTQPEFPESLGKWKAPPLSGHPALGFVEVHGTKITELNT